MKKELVSALENSFTNNTYILYYVFSFQVDFKLQNYCKLHWNWKNILRLLSLLAMIYL